MILSVAIVFSVAGVGLGTWIGFGSPLSSENEEMVVDFFSAQKNVHLPRPLTQPARRTLIYEKLAADVTLVPLQPRTTFTTADITPDGRLFYTVVGPPLFVHPDGQGGYKTVQGEFLSTYLNPKPWIPSGLSKDKEDAVVAYFSALPRLVRQPQPLTRLARRTLIDQRDKLYEALKKPEKYRAMLYPDGLLSSTRVLSWKGGPS